MSYKNYFCIQFAILITYSWLIKMFKGIDNPKFKMH